jgi:hypothetical protein
MKCLLSMKYLLIIRKSVGIIADKLKVQSLTMFFLYLHEILAQIIATTFNNICYAIRLAQNFFIYINHIFWLGGFKSILLFNATNFQLISNLSWNFYQSYYINKTFSLALLNKLSENQQKAYLFNEKTTWHQTLYL